MKPLTLGDLQESVQDRLAFQEIGDYFTICSSFLSLVNDHPPTRVVSPSHPHYIFYQYDEEYHHKITRPLNSYLFIESVSQFSAAYQQFMSFLDELRRKKHAASKQKAFQKFLDNGELCKVVYTIQQSIGCIGDSFDNANQSRKRIGQLFENLIALIISQVGLECEPRTINLPIPGFPGYQMSYQLDLVFSPARAIISAETSQILPSEVVGSVKTTSKDRIDKIFLDKYLLTKLIGRDVPVIAIFLHDVQRAVRGNSIFGINSTFKSNHFLGYTVALNKLDGVYYVDPRPEMVSNPKLAEQIRDFQQFLVRDLWLLSKP